MTRAKHKGKGKAKGKAKQQRGQQRREARRAQRNSQQRARRGRRGDPCFAGEGLAPEEELLSSDPPMLYSGTAPVCFDASGATIPDPYVVLGLERQPDGPPPEEEIRAAYRERLLANPPEWNPEMARELLAARELLLDPELVVERELGVVYPPDPEAWGLSGALPEPRQPDLLAAGGRIMAELLLYALLEDEVHEFGSVRRPRKKDQMSLL